VGVNYKHPDYRVREEDWRMINDGIEGQRVVKSRKEEYLPSPPGISAGTNAYLSSGKRENTLPYYFYLSFAEFPEMLGPILETWQSIVHGKLPKYRLGGLSYMEDDATPVGDSLVQLWQDATEMVFRTGRVVFLSEIMDDDTIRICAYPADSLINWRQRDSYEGGGASMLVFQEFEDSTPELTSAESDELQADDRGVRDTYGMGDDDEFKLRRSVYYRELRMIPTTAGEMPIYQYRLWELDRATEDGLKYGYSTMKPDLVQGWTPVLYLGQPLTHIPVTICNSTRVGFEYTQIPMLPFAREAFAAYRLSADYYRALYYKSDPQAYVTGIDPSEVPTHIGGDTIWGFTNPSARAEYLDIDGNGIPLLKSAIDDKMERINTGSGRFLSERSQESGEAIRRRSNNRSLTIRNVVTQVGNALQSHLRKIAEMRGQDPSAVYFVPDLDFSEPRMTADDVLRLTQSKVQGAPLSNKTLHELMYSGGLTEMTYEEEMALVEQDFANLARMTGSGGAEEDPDEGEDDSKTEDTGLGAPPSDVKSPNEAKEGRE